MDKNCETWKSSSRERKQLEEKERMREERKRKAEREKLTFKIGFVQKKISNFLKKLPSEEKRKYESEQEKQRRLKLKEIRETMWKKSRLAGKKNTNWRKPTEWRNTLQTRKFRRETIYN